MRLLPYVFILALTLFYACKEQPTGVQAGDIKDTVGVNTTVKEASDAPVSSDHQEVATAAEIMAKPQIPVLCYHRIRQSTNQDAYSVSLEQFRAQMQMLSDSGYVAITPQQLYDNLVYGADLPARPVLLTFDDNRVEHIEIAAPEMEKLNLHGAFFIMTITIGKKNYMTREQIRELSERGHTIGCHSWDHHDARKYTAADWQKQSVEQQKLLAEITGKPVHFWAYPFGSHNRAAAEELSKYYKLSFILADKRIPEVPLQTVRRILVPYGWSGARLLKAMQRSF